VIAGNNKKAKNIVRHQKTNMNSLEDFLILLSYLLSHHATHILKQQHMIPTHILEVSCL